MSQPTSCGGVCLFTLTKTKIKDLINLSKDFTFKPNTCARDVMISKGSMHEQNPKPAYFLL